MKVGDRILYGEYKEQHIDEIEQNDKGYYYGKYIVNNATTPEFKNLEDLFKYYTDNKYFLYVVYDMGTERKVLKDIEKLLREYGKEFSSDVFKVQHQKFTIKTIKYLGEIYYWKEIFNLDSNEREIIIKLVN